MKSTQVFKFICLIFLSFCLTSCSVLFSGKTQNIHINTQPNNAKILLDHNYVGNSPRTIEVRKKMGPTEITISKEGFVDTTFRLKKKISKLALLSVFNVWIDVIAGTALRYKHEYYNVNLTSLDKEYRNAFHKPRSMFYIIKMDGDTIFTQPFININAGYYSGEVKNIEFVDITGGNQKIDPSLVRKIKTQTKNVILNSAEVIGDGYMDYVITYLNVPYNQSEKYNVATYMVEFLENEKLHLVWSTLDTDAIDEDGNSRNIISGNYYLYEEGKSLVKLDYINSKKVILKYFNNYPEIIKMLKANPDSFSIWDYFFDRRYDLENKN